MTLWTQILCLIPAYLKTDSEEAGKMGSAVWWDRRHSVSKVKNRTENKKIKWLIHVLC